jgi:hypothetical protein
MTGREEAPTTASERLLVAQGLEDAESTAPHRRRLSGQERVHLREVVAHVAIIRAEERGQRKAETLFNESSNHLDRRVHPAVLDLGHELGSELRLASQRFLGQRCGFTETAHPSCEVARTLALLAAPGIGGASTFRQRFRSSRNTGPLTIHDRERTSTPDKPIGYPGWCWQGPSFQERAR